METPRKYIAATIVLCLSSFFVLKIGRFLFEQQTQHSIDFIGHYFGTGTNRKEKANVFALSGWVRYCHNDLTTNKKYFDFLSPVASFGPK